MSLLKAAALLLIPGAPNSGSLANSGSKGCIFTGKWLGCFNLIENNPEKGKNLNTQNGGNGSFFAAFLP